MDWVKEGLSVLGLVLALFVTGFSIHKAYFELSFVRKRDFDEWEKFKQREKEFDEDTQLFEKEALLRTVGFLKNFTWGEYCRLKKYDIDLKSVKSINVLKKTNYINFDGLIFIIPKNLKAYDFILKDAKFFYVSLLL